MANNALDQLLLDIKDGEQSYPPLTVMAEAWERLERTGSVDLMSALNAQDELFFEWLCKARPGVVSVEETGAVLKPAGINHGVVSVTVLPPVELVEVSDGNGGAVWMEVTR